MSVKYFVPDFSHSLWPQVLIKLKTNSLLKEKVVLTSRLRKTSMCSFSTFDRMVKWEAKVGLDT